MHFRVTPWRPTHSANGQEHTVKSSSHDEPFPEYSATGVAPYCVRSIAAEYGCTVVDIDLEKIENPSLPATSTAPPANYDSFIAVNKRGELIENYWGKHLSDGETRAINEPGGFLKISVPNLGEDLIGIGLDLHPSGSPALQHALGSGSRAQSSFVIVLLAGTTSGESQQPGRAPSEPDMETLKHRILSLEPIVCSGGQSEVILILCNRTSYEQNASYTGISAIVGIHEGKIKVYELLGLVVDTDAGSYKELIRGTGTVWKGSKIRLVTWGGLVPFFPPPEGEGGSTVKDEDRNRHCQALRRSKL
ncbi:Carbon-nitrogen family [Fusarium albosuccineum]|uniref:Carbon-nitrogen family n=1 Tax=Fusarium albosuccineum TaxID=1237068 RepID=A0A8H4P3S0_9HYPO|nr:Carbon-nitrogen family [Fusarium albosuccineum]